MSKDRKCEEADDYMDCPNMKERDDSSMEAETYECEKCGKYYRLYYDEMR